jgi:hypothetical protein
MDGIQIHYGGYNLKWNIGGVCEKMGKTNVDKKYITIKLK